MALQELILQGRFSGRTRQDWKDKIRNKSFKIPNTAIGDLCVEVPEERRMGAKCMKGQRVGTAPVHQVYGIPPVINCAGLLLLNI